MFLHIKSIPSKMPVQKYTIPINIPSAPGQPFFYDDFDWINYSIQKTTKMLKNTVSPNTSTSYLKNINYHAGANYS